VGEQEAECRTLATDTRAGLHRAPTTPGLEALGQRFAISNTSPLDPSIQIPPTIGAATGLEFLGHGEVLAAGEPTRRGGSSAAIVSLHSENDQ
jgi:gamma-glutamyltranspeptidase / glutathione hydrolase